LAGGFGWRVVIAVVVARSGWGEDGGFGVVGVEVEAGVVEAFAGGWLVVVWGDPDRGGRICCSLGVVSVGTGCGR
jgi:hypothetical protein